MRSEATEIVLASLSSKLTYTAGIGGMVYGFLTSSALAFFVGSVATAFTAWVNWHFKRRSDARAAEWHEARLEAVRRGVVLDEHP